MCKIFTRLKIQSKLAQKLLSMVVSLSLMAGMVPGKMVQAAPPTTFVSSAYANHWGRSDLRAYLNNATKINGTLPLDTTIDGTNSANFPSKFSDAEIALVQLYTYMTNVVDTNKNAVAAYKTTDRFWLPSKNSFTGRVTHWGSEDINEDSQHNKSIAADRSRLIPISYWSYGASVYSWVRSADFMNFVALQADRNSFYGNNRVDLNMALAAACKINIGSVIFASAALAKDIVNGNESGGKKIEITGSTNFGKNTSASLPDYGMYLKTRSGKSFTANSLSLSGNNLTVRYMGGEAGQYVVVQAFNDDSLTAGTTGYVAAKQLEAGQTSATIDVTNWGISSLSGYTVKVWMEDSTGSLAKATVPTTFVGTTKTETGAVKNGRVFAMKADLQCAWGDLAALIDDDYKKVVAGMAATETDTVAGLNPTNQKIYFGRHNGAPLEFWIAGRETAANGGAIDKDGEIMTLYQAKSVETRKFNASISGYSADEKPAVALRLAQDPVSKIYNSTAEIVYPEEQVTTANLVDGYTLNWLHRTPGTSAWTEGMPKKADNYEVRCYTPGTENYEPTYSNVVNFIVKKIPKLSDFVFTAPSNLVYDGTPKTVTVEPKSGITGMGAVIVKYYNVNGDGTLGAASTTAPTDAGSYKVKFDVADGTKFAAATDLPVILIL